jgi:hypothetical protein
MLALLIPLALAAAPVRVGIVTIDAGDDVNAFTSAILFALDDPKRFVVVDQKEMAKHVEAAASVGIRCEIGDAACFARVGAFAKTPLLLFVNANASAAKVTVVDAATSTSRIASSPLPKDPAQHTSTISTLVSAAIDNTPAHATLALLAAGEEAFVDVDNTPRGSPPLTLEDLAPGPHDVRVHAKDGRERKQTVELYAGNVVTLETTLPPPAPREERPAPPPPSISPLLVAGGVIAGLGAVATVGTAVGALVVTPDPSRRGEYTAREFNDATSTGAALWIGAGVSAAVFVVGAGLAGVALTDS